MKVSKIKAMTVASMVVGILVGSALNSFAPVSNIALADAQRNPTVSPLPQFRPGASPFPLYLPLILKNAPADTFWSLVGNAGTNPATHFLGTTDAQPLVVRTSNIEWMRITSDGNVGIGTFNPSALLSVVKSAAPEPVVQSVPTGLKVGTPSGTIPLALRQNAVESGQPALAHFETGNGNLGYLGANTSAFIMGSSANHGLGFNVDGSTRAMTVLANGTVGIGTTTPCTSNKLHVSAGNSGIGCNTAAVFAESISGDGVIAYSQNSSGMEAFSVNGYAIFQGWDYGALQRRFVVERATGNVLADGSFLPGGADFAEMMPVSGLKNEYTPGDVMVIGTDGKLTRSTKPNATSLAGVYSSKPGFLGDTEIAAHGIGSYDSPSTQERLAVALVGIVPVKVTDESGPIHPGDLLTTSSIPGHAMKAKPTVINGVEIYPTGTILGKALESWEQGAGLIQVLITLR